MKRLVSSFLITLLGLSSTASASTINIDFGASSTATKEIGWNNVTETTGSDKGYELNLVDAFGHPTGIKLEITSRFNGANTTGSASGAGFGLPATATKDSLYGNLHKFNGLSDVKPVITFTGMDPNSHYSFKVIAARANAEDVRTSDYTATGSNSQTMTLDASNNTRKTISLSNIKPTAGGKITFSIEVGSDNDNALRFIYLNALVITSSDAK